ncbi:sulfatase [Reichenbachiella sp. MALMAid0571]|uniref:sulfatase n=1 Tax=Reichenbachiella sp. MALMAid0571 TaxID=3143939 RepID=UPI0032DF34A7
MNLNRISLFFLLICCFLIFGSTTLSLAGEGNKKPNVLFVIFDDLNDWEGVLKGHPQALTPNIDRLAKKGVLFTNAHCAGVMCNPSRASVITGLRPTTTGIYTNNDTPFDLYKNKQTLNKHFKENGYYVAGAGKVLHKFYYEKDDWDEFSGRRKEEGVVHNRDNPEPENIRNVAGVTWGAFSTPDSLTYDARSVKWVSERIDQDHDKPFFLACGIFRPHTPWFNPKEYFDKYSLEDLKLPSVDSNDLDDVPLIGKNIAFSTTNFTDPNDLHNDVSNKDHEAIKKQGAWKEAVQGYLASVSYADAQFGKLLDALERSPYADNTIIVLWSDHGYHLGEKEHWHKGTLWEQVTRIPLVVSAPGIKNGSECKEAVSLIDIYPTLLDLCDLPDVTGLEGRSLVPQLRNSEKKRSMPAVSSINPNYHSIRDERYRYITYGDGQEELYDHNKDPEERTNLAEDPKYNKIIQKLKKYIPTDSKAALMGSYSE